MGNVGRLAPGDVQWMKAGSGVIHSEMPKQEEGRMHGFQLWLNLPASEKMTPATYRDLEASTIPSYELGTAKINAIAGELLVDDIEVKGAVTGLSTDPAYLDISFGTAQKIDFSVPDGYTALVYVYSGSVSLNDSERLLTTGNLARLSRDGLLRMEAHKESKVLLITGKPIGEPIAHRGPFVMNTLEEIHQAIRDYSNGNLVQG